MVGAAGLSCIDEISFASAAALNPEGACSVLATATGGFCAERDAQRRSYLNGNSSWPKKVRGMGLVVP